MKKNIKILITGANGYIGNCLYLFLKGKFKVIGIDKETTFNDAEFGMIGLESCFGVVNKVLVKDNGMSLKSLIEKLTVNPRKIMNINRDLFAVGEKAKITIFDPNEKWVLSEENIYSKSSNSPFIGHNLVGKVKYVCSKDSFFAV